jgi:hypothetical protein
LYLFEKKHNISIKIFFGTTFLFFLLLEAMLRKQTIWVRTDIPLNAQNLIKAILMRIPTKILRKNGNVVAQNFFSPVMRLILTS